MTISKWFHRTRTRLAALSVSCLLGLSMAAVPAFAEEDVTAPEIQAPAEYTVEAGQIFSLTPSHRGSESMDASHTDDSGKYGRFSITAVTLNGESLPVNPGGCVHFTFPEAGDAVLTVTALDPAGNAATIDVPVKVTEPAISPEAILTEVMANTKALQSAEGTMTMTISMGMPEIDDLSLDLKMNMDMQIITAPAAAAMTGSIDVLGESMPYSIYLVSEGENMKQYSYINGEWTTGDYSLAQAAALIDPTMGSAEAVTAIPFVLSDETEEFIGKEVYVMTAQVPYESLDVQMMAMPGMDQIGMEEVLESMKGTVINITYRVYKEEMLPAEIKVSFDLSEAEIMNNPDLSGVQFNELSYGLVYTGFNCVDEIVVPEEAQSGARSALNGADGQTGTIDAGLAGNPVEAEMPDDLTDGTLEDPAAEMPEVPAAEMPEVPAAEVPELNAFGETPLAPNEDGSFTLWDADHTYSADIMVPEGFQADDLSYENGLFFIAQNEDGTHMAYVTYEFTKLTEEEAAVYLEDSVSFMSDFFSSNEVSYTLDVVDLAESGTLANGLSANGAGVIYAPTENPGLHTAEYVVLSHVNEDLYLLLSIFETADGEDLVLVPSVFPEMYAQILGDNVTLMN